MQTPPTVPKFKTQFNHVPASSRDLVCKKPSLTDQSFKQEADINHLMARYRQCGSFYNPLDPIRHNRPLPQFGDFSALPDLSSAITTVAHAQEMFARLPAEIREACNHDPAQFLALEKDPRMQELLRKYGLVPDPSGVQGIKSPATASNGVPNPSPSNEPAPASNPKTSA